MGIDVDEEIVLVAFGLPRGMREDIARVGLHGDFLQFAELLRESLKHACLLMRNRDQSIVKQSCAESESRYAPS